MREEATPGDLAAAMAVLASPVRLGLLHRLARGAFIPVLAKEMGLTRQALRKHLDELEAAGLIVAIPSRRGALPATEYRTDPVGLFAFKESVLGLAVHAEPASLRPAATLPFGAQGPVAVAPGAGLLLVHGDQPGRWFTLAGRSEALLGRDASADVALTYDAFASLRHALLRRSAGGWTLTDLGSMNGTRVNFERVPMNGSREVKAGDLITVGKSHLLLRDEG